MISKIKKSMTFMQITKLLSQGVTFTQITKSFTKISLIIDKVFVRLYLDHVDTIHDEVYNVSFQQKLELFQYNTW